MTRHPSTRTWQIAEPGAGMNIRELASRPGRFEHHLVPCATIGPVQLEVATASEPLYFAHVNISDEYAVALPTGDPLVDAFPLRTFVSDPASGADVGRYNHRVGDLVLHPLGAAHWPGRLRPPFAPPPFPPGTRRAGVSLVYCATTPTPSTAPRVELPPARAGDVKAYVPAPPPLVLAPLDRAGVVAAIGATTLEVVVAPSAIAPPHGGWVVVLEGATPLALLRVASGEALPCDGIGRALVFASSESAPDEIAPAWRALPAPPFAPFEDGAPGELPVTHGDLGVTARSATIVDVAVGDAHAEVPRYWLARMLFRVALHGLRLGVVETYGGFYLDDSAGAGGTVDLGLRTAAGRAAITLSRPDALAFVETLYRAVAPPGYVERI